MARGIFILFIFIFLPVVSVLAQNLNPDSSKPLEITADGSLEWHRNELYFRAKKNVKARQGQTVLISDVLTAKYRDDENGGVNIYIIQAEGNVEIASPQSKAYGDKAIYDVDKGYAIMVGDDLRLISDDQNVSARDKFIYWVNGQKLEAIGKARAVRLGDVLEADKIIAIFEKDSQEKQVLKSLEAVGNVVITTTDEVLTGDSAVYSAISNIAKLTGNVKITRGPNIVEGERAQVNLETNVSKIFGGAGNNSADVKGVGNNGRVRAVFHPKSLDNNKDNN